MHNKFTTLDAQLYEYLVKYGARQDQLLRKVELDTEALGPQAIMQISPEEGALLNLLVKAITGTHALEIGTFTGYSAICIARGLADDGTLLTCEINSDYAQMASENISAAGLEEKVSIALGPAVKTLSELKQEHKFDFAFIDADKPSYDQYYELTLKHLRAGGIIVIDNVFQRRRVVAPDPDDVSAQAISTLNKKISNDDRVDCAMLPVADGITIIRKR